MRSEAVASLGVSQEFRRLWDLYLAYCAASFLERHISDIQLILAKSGRADEVGGATRTITGPAAFDTEYSRCRAPRRGGSVAVPAAREPTAWADEGR